MAAERTLCHALVAFAAVPREASEQLLRVLTFERRKRDAPPGATFVLRGASI
jgi:hypothetical protein